MIGLVENNDIVLETTVGRDSITDSISRVFDYTYDGRSKVTIHCPDFPKDFSIGVIYGSSGSGKSTLLHRCFGEEEHVEWERGKAIASHFGSFEEASARFGAVGLNSIPAWLRDYGALSNGERFRADMARRLKDYAVIDEFTSVVNRETAVSCSCAISKYIRGNGLHNIVFCTCHDDILPYLEPDWVYDTDRQTFLPRGSLHRPQITVRVRACKASVWDMFKRHHYLSGDLNGASVCYLATLNDIPVAFLALLALQGRDVRHAWREHRLVTLPDFQGMGIGNRFSEAMGQAYREMGCTYFCKTSNPRIGEHRDRSPLWRATATNHQARESYLNTDGSLRDWNPRYGMKQELVKYHAHRVCYSHEYIGDGTVYPYIYETQDVRRTKDMETVSFGLFDD